MTFFEILQKALNDQDFGRRVVADPESALKEVGVKPTPKKILALKDATHALLSGQNCIRRWQNY